jgi:hypothetical protein
MILPNGENAFVDIAKIEGYCLNLAHPEGRHKARVFQSVLGLTVNDAEWLRDAMISAALTHPAQQTEADQYGVRYNLDFELTFKSRSAIIRACWIIRANENYPRLTTCYIL